MQQSLCRLLLTAIVWILALGNTSIHAQSSNEVCIRKTLSSGDDLVFSPDSKYLVSGWDEENGVARLWDVETGKVAQTFTDTVEGMREYQRLGRFAFSSDGKYLLTGHMNSYIVLRWNVQTGQKLYKIDHSDDLYGEGMPEIVVSANDKYFAMWAEYGIRIFSFETGVPLSPFLGTSFIPAFTSEPVFTRDSRYILADDNNLDHGFFLWDIRAARKAFSFGKNVGYLTDASFVDNGRYIAIISTFDHIKFILTLWNAATYHRIRTIDIGDDPDFVKFSADGKLVVVENRQGPGLMLWDTVQGRLLYILTNTLTNRGLPAIFTPDNRFLLIAVKDPQRPDYVIYRLWDIRLKKEKPDFFIDYGYGTIAISPNSKFLAATQEDSTLRLWNLVTGQELHLDC